MTDPVPSNAPHEPTAALGDDNSGDPSAIDDSAAEAPASADPREARRDRAALLMAQGSHYNRIAQQIGVSERTVRRWAAEPGFATQVAELRAIQWRGGMGALAQTIPAAVATLVEMMRDSHADSVRVSSARTLLYAGVRYRSMEPEEAAQIDQEQGQIIEWLHSPELTGGDLLDDDDLDDDLAG